MTACNYNYRIDYLTPNGEYKESLVAFADLFDYQQHAKYMLRTGFTTSVRVVEVKHEVISEYNAEREAEHRTKCLNELHSRVREARS